jgi:ParB family chromosome partitioning protein
MSRKSQLLKNDQAIVEEQPNDENLQPPERMIALASISLPRSQPRRYFHPTKMEQLIESVKEHGILENLIVRPLAECNSQYELVVGERRYRAAIAAGLDEVPATIRYLSEEQALVLALVENLQREDLNSIDETEGILQLLALRLTRSVDNVISLLYRMQDESKGKVPQNVLGNEPGKTAIAVFEELNKYTWESFVSSRLPLLKLPSDILSLVRDGKLAYTKAIAIAKVKGEVEREALLDNTLVSQLSLSQIRERVKALQPQQPQSPKAKIQAVARTVTQSRVWEDQQKWQRVNALLEELSALVGEDGG